MLIPFENLPKSSRIWIYQSAKSFSEDEKSAIFNRFNIFLSEWDAHGNPLQASFKIEYDHFIILAVNENYNHVSGCSIDKSVHFIQSLEKDFSLNLFDRLHQPIWNNGQIEFKTLKEIKEAINSGHFKNDTIVFNSMIQTLEDLELNWEIPAERSWLNKFVLEKNQ